MKTHLRLRSSCYRRRASLMIRSQTLRKLPVLRTLCRRAQGRTNTKTDVVVLVVRVVCCNDRATCSGGIVVPAAAPFNAIRARGRPLPQGYTKPRVRARDTAALTLTARNAALLLRRYSRFRSAWMRWAVFCMRFLTCGAGRSRLAWIKSQKRNTLSARCHNGVSFPIEWSGDKAVDP